MSVASNKIKGEAGTTVKMEILRGTETKEFELKRESIKVNPVEGKVLQNNIGYIEFSSFDEETADEFKAKFEELQKQGIKSLIIDLRNNGGGIVDEALQIADYILNKDDVILYEVDKNNKEKVEKAEKDPIIDMPIQWKSKNSRNKNIWKRSNSTIINIARWKWIKNNIRRIFDTK